MVERVLKFFLGDFFNRCANRGANRAVNRGVNRVNNRAANRAVVNRVSNRADNRAARAYRASLGRIIIQQKRAEERKTAGGLILGAKNDDPLFASMGQVLDCGGYSLRGTNEERPWPECDGTGGEPLPPGTYILHAAPNPWMIDREKNIVSVNCDHLVMTHPPGEPPEWWKGA